MAKNSILSRIKSSIHIGRALRLVWQTAPRWTAANFAITLLQGVLPIAGLYLIKLIIDAVSDNLTSPDKSAAFQQVVPWIFLAGVIAVLTALMRSLGEYASEAQSLQVTDAVADRLHSQSLAIDLEYYEDPDYYDTLHRAQKEAPHRPTRIVNGLIQVGQNGISLIGIVALLFSFNGWLALALFLASLPGVVLRLRHSRRLYGLEKAQTEKERRSWYYHSLITDAPYAKEQRLFNLGAMFQERYSILRKQIREGKLILAGSRVLSELFAQILATAALFGSLAWIAHQTIQGLITIGDLTVLFLGFQSGLNFLQALLRAVAGLYESNLFLTNLYHFLDMTPKIIAPASPCAVPLPIRQGVAFNNVGFSYTGTGKESLHDISLTLAPGEIIALVGENGSGKTTLVKLLCRIYDTTSGNITVDGIDIRNLDPVLWRKEISVAFQDYAHYALTARENIWLGNVEKEPDQATIETAGRRSGADTVIRRLPRAYDTMLGHWFQKGHELSGGEWQKIALSRTFWREARIIVLDEPTSSIDPLAEADLFQGFREMLGGRSAILISHRFSTVQMADCIYVMERGQIVERGTHQALLAQNGAYANLYRAQARHYQD